LIEAKLRHVCRGCEEPQGVRGVADTAING